MSVKLSILEAMRLNDIATKKYIDKQIEEFKKAPNGTKGFILVKALPSLSEAIENTLYYIEKEQSGFVLNEDKTDWIQVIYPPAALDEETENAIAQEIIKKVTEELTIDFAGTEFERSENGLFITKELARVALDIDGIDEKLEDVDKDLDDLKKSVKTFEDGLTWGRF